MSTPGEDHRSACSRARDEQFATEPPLPPPDLPADAAGSPVEDQLARHRQTQDDKLSNQVDEQFCRAADYVMKKNAELYRRLT